jgi:hypothetical protein
MADKPITIDSNGNPSPGTLNCKSGDQITWTNNSGQIISSFTLPTCVSPQTTPAPIAVSATTRQFTVNNNTAGSYSYSYMLPGITGGPRTGTVDVGN